MRIILGILVILNLLNADLIRDHTKEVVEDRSNNLVWQDNSEVKTIKKDWQGAIAYCKGLGDGWRLPSFNELYSITEHSKKSPAISSAFENVSTDDWYWSSTTYASADAHAWVVSFHNGNDGYNHEDSSDSVRCVRGQSFEDLTKTQGSDTVSKGNIETFTLFLRRNLNETATHLKMTYNELKQYIWETKRMALVIGINDYSQDRNGFDSLPTSVKDAQDMHDYLKNDLKFDKVILLINRNATVQNINNAIDILNILANGNDSNNDIVFYYSGHGEQFNDSPRIVPYDGKTQSANLPKMVDIVGNVVRDRFKHRLFIFDSCYSGNIDEISSDIVVMSPDKERELKQKVSSITKENIATAMYYNGTHILTSSSQNQLAQASPTRWGGNSLFTHYLLKGIKEKRADSTPDGVITLPEIWNYLRDNISHEQQKPVLKDYPFGQTWRGEFMFYKKEQ